jgi:hypothetical protein
MKLLGLRLKITATILLFTAKAEARALCLWVAPSGWYRRTWMETAHVFDCMRGETHQAWGICHLHSKLQPACYLSSRRWSLISQDCKPPPEKWCGRSSQGLALLVNQQKSAQMFQAKSGLLLLMCTTWGAKGAVFDRHIWPREDEVVG